MYGIDIIKFYNIISLYDVKSQNCETNEEISRYIKKKTEWIDKKKKKLLIFKI